MSTTIDLTTLARELGPRIAEGAAARDAAGDFVFGNFEILKAHRVFSAQVPAEFGGGGARHSEMCAFVRALAHSCPSTALSLSMHQHLVAAAVVNYRNGRPGQQLLERVGGAETVLVSTGANDWLESNGSVTRADGGYRVSARKPFGSGSPAGEVLVTSAPYEDPKEGWQVLHFAVPFAAEGVSLAADWDTMGMRATGSHTVILDEVFVPDEAIGLTRPRGEYHMVYNVILAVAMPLIMSAYVGVAEAAAEIVRGQAAKRQGDPVAPFLFGELANLLTTAQIAVDDMVRIADDGDFAPTVETANAILIRKTIAAKAVLATTEKALEATGGAGFFRRFELALGLDPVETAILPKPQAAAA